jgi:hypothetical protein
MKEPKEFDYFKAWLLFFVIATVGGGLVGIIVGAFVGAFLGAGGMPPPQMTRILQIVGFIIAFRFPTSRFGPWSANICFLRSRRMNRQRPNPVMPFRRTQGPKIIPDSCSPRSETVELFGRFCDDFGFEIGGQLLLIRY